MIEKLEHDFEIEKKTYPTLMEFLKTFQLSEPLNPRDSFFGGRANGVRLHCVAAAREEIRYVDINSLYPYVNKTKNVSSGSPRDFGQSNKSRYCQLLWHSKSQDSPTTPFVSSSTPRPHWWKTHVSPMYTMCKGRIGKTMVDWYSGLHPHCGGTLYNGHLVHIRVAESCRPWLQDPKIHEVWHFSENQRKDDLFADYVNKWLKNKTEASGWHKNCTTEAAKSEYINAYYDREGVQLEPAKVAKNGGRKQVAKLCSTGN